VGRISETTTADSKEDIADVDDLMDSARRRRDSAGIGSRVSCEGRRFANAVEELA
jgi:hypothetical protein